MAIRLPDASRNAMADALTLLVNTGGAGSIQIRTGAQPAAGGAATGTLLATVALAADAFGNAAAGTAALVDPPAVTGVAAGDAGWFRVLSGAAATVYDGNVTATGGGGDMQLSTVTISVGVSVDITAGSITVPAG